ncbi:GLPGLI family protein [Chryseobacterium sediminis]|uniref:GLPGLI family protein n=1 Tax=Chryseobacterium sediminis TaxID=1679494 RepID=A0A5B2U4V6_9FLAO|nr:GLPGLI family protein [Chryseobacterium sediminis]KAA2221487.1 GLPGLI family protein [Chryseobacterium sediminis]
MKKVNLFVFFIVLFSCACTGQVHRFYYELTYKPSTKNKTLKKDLFYLDSLERGSVFMRKEKCESDSLLAAQVYLPILSLETMNFKVVKDLKNPSVTVKDDLFIGTISYKESADIQWKLSSENRIIGTLQTQKAETDYGGRHWIAWFTQEIPVFDGPYIFMGLPGLIVELSDTNNEYHWKFIGSKKNVRDKLFTESIMDEAVMSKEAYIKNKTSFIKDPLPVLMQSMSDVSKNEEIMSKMNRQAESIKKYYRDNDNTIEK